MAATFPRADPLRLALSPGGRVFGATVLVSFAAKGAALQQGFGFDDYPIILSDPAHQAGLLLWQVRTVGAALLATLQRLQLDGIHASGVWVAALIATLSLLGTLVARQWRLLSRGWIGYAVAAMVALHPYGCDTLHMRSAIAPAVVMLGLLCALLVPLRWTPRRVVSGGLIFALAVATYALALHYLLVFVFASLAVTWGRLLAAAARRGWSPRLRGLARPRRLLRHRSVALLACAALGLFLHGVTAAGFLAWRGSDVTSRTKLLEADRAVERTRQVLEVLTRHLVGHEPWLPRAVQSLLVATLAAALCGLALRFTVRPTVPGFAVSLGVVAALAAAAASSLAVILVLAEFWPAPRIMASIAIFWAAVWTLAHRLLPRRAGRPLGIAMTIVLAAFVGVDNRILGEQLRLNRRDAHLANRIAARLEATPGFAPGLPLAMVGRQASYPQRLATQYYDTNVSAFGAAWARVAVIEETTGLRFARPSPEQRGAAQAYCALVEPYPGPESVVVEGGLGIVCLAPAEAP